MAEGSITLTTSRVVFIGDSFEADVPIGAHFDYRPDDGSTGRVGNLNFIPGPDTGAGHKGEIQPGIYSEPDGTVHLAVSRRMLLNKTPGTLTVTVYQDPELLGQDYAVRAVEHIA